MHDELRVLGFASSNAARGFEAIHDRHGEVHENEAWGRGRRAVEEGSVALSGEEAVGRSVNCGVGKFFGVDLEEAEVDWVVFYEEDGGGRGRCV